MSHCSQGLCLSHSRVHTEQYTLSTWNYDFPSTVERWAWRISCIAISAFDWVWMSLGVVSIMRNRSIGKLTFLTLSLIDNILLWVVTNGLLYVGMFARVFVVVE
jgi:hypothetical protein